MGGGWPGSVGPVERTPSDTRGPRQGAVGSRAGPPGPPPSRPPRPRRPRSPRSGPGPGCGSGAASSWSSPGTRWSPRRARSRRRHCGAGFARTSRQGSAPGRPLPAVGMLAARGAGGKGAQAMLPGSEGGGGQRQAHVPPNALQVPRRGQEQSHHQPSRKRGRGSAAVAPGRLEACPGAQAARGVKKRRRKVRRSLVPSSSRPAPLRLPSRGRRLLAPAPWLRAACKSPAGSSSHP